MFDSNKKVAAPEWIKGKETKALYRKLPSEYQERVNPAAFLSQIL